ncbi:iron permease [Streptomyces sp. NRRL B-1140]|uniref:iron uptake transporter permease EfeU n=1 Tax=Streptomyces sp. NRRL B-1140 TaxID=1415549 RepID=UPI0006B02F72|nr:iron uptake transporter permease EfeU [Streptomyces sp. NRRL B-1140]KOX04479.1 iron permease [Streptomyces sp. NRRL B-1140]
MWDDSFPSFLIGLREGLEAGLVVSVLVATLVRAGARSRLAQVWTGVLAAIALSMSFGAVLTFTAASLSTPAQEAFGGALSIVAVAFVTAMVFWMRRSARGLASEIREKVTEALTMGAGVLILTSFLAVGREGLETALFLWTTARAADESAGPLAGAGVGLALAALLCWGLYRRVLRIDLTRFFTVTGAVLVVIAAGVLGYGLRDLQEGGVLPGGAAFAFDLSGSVDAGSWYSTLLQGVLNLTPAMTWLQVAGYVGYLAVVMPLFVRGVRGVPGTRRTGPALSPADSRPDPTAGRAARRHRLLLPLAVVAVPAVLAALVVALAHPKPAAGQTVAVSETDCGQGFTAPKPGRQDFRMHNTGNQTSEVYLIDPASNAVYGEVEGLAPGTTRDLVATVAGGTYAWRCVPADGGAVTSQAVRVTGAAGAHAVLPVSERDLTAPLTAYKAYVNRGLSTLVAQTRRLGDDIRAGHLDTARADWLTAHRTYASLGAAYGTFEDFDQKINGRPDGLPGGVHDPGFTGFHRIEYGLWHGQSAAELKGPAQQLADNAAGLRKAFPHQDFDPADLPLRAHEILENTLQFELTGDTDQGSGTGLATADANLAGTRELLTVLRPLLTPRAPRLLPTVDADLTRLQRLLDSEHHGGRWTPVDRLDPEVKARIDGATGQLLEDLSPVPDLLEIRKSA